MSRSRASLSELLVELGRRRVFRTAALYLVVALVAVEVTEALTGGPDGLPLRAVTMAAWAAILGFPLAVGLAWTYDVTPRGIVRTGPQSESEAVLERRRRRLSTQVGFRLTLTGVAAATVGAITWVVLEPFLPEVEQVETVEAAPVTVSGTVHVAPVAVSEGIEAALAERVGLRLLLALSERPGLRPVDPREIGGAGAGDAVSDAAARAAGAERVLRTELVPAPEGLALTASLRSLGDDPGSPAVEARAAGSADEIDVLVERVVEELASAVESGSGGAADG